MEAVGSRAEILTGSQMGIARQLFVLPSSLQNALIQLVGFQVIRVCMYDEESGRGMRTFFNKVG